MIAQATTIAHGGVSINYITRLGKAEMVKLNHLPSDVEVHALWAHMKAHRMLHLDKRSKGHPLKRDMIRIEISPERNDSNNWSINDWRELLEQFVRAFDNADVDKSDFRFRGHKCSLANSQYLATLHRDSDSGIIHIHLDCNRVDMDGNLNDDFKIGERAVYAANKVTHERGWVQAEQRAAENRERISKDCIDVLKDMPRFNWGGYATRLTVKGYNIQLHRDSEGKVRGYAIRMGNSIYKSSVLGHGRNLMPSKIENTWNRLHPQKPAEISRQNPITTRAFANTVPDVHVVSMKVKDSEFDITIPQRVFDTIGDETQQMGAYPISDAFIQTVRTAVLLFVNCIGEANTYAQTCGGGGASPSSGWGRDKDEDELEWARRCARMAHDMITTRKRTYRR